MMEPNNRISPFAGSGRHSRVRRRRKQSYLLALNLDKSLPLLRTTKTWTSASLLDRLRARRAPARRFQDELNLVLNVRSDRSDRNIGPMSDMSHRSDKSNQYVAEPSMRATK